MGNTIGKVFTLFIAVLLLVIYPLMQLFQQQEFTTRMFVYTETTKLVDAVRNTGYLTARMYEEYTSKLSATNMLYDIDLEHQHRKYDPIYENPSDASTFKNDYGIHYSGYYTKEILEVLFPDNNTGSELYRLSQGDYFVVKVINKNKTSAVKMSQLLLGRDLPAETIFVRYGGMVK